MNFKFTFTILTGLLYFYNAGAQNIPVHKPSVTLTAQQQSSSVLYFVENAGQITDQYGRQRADLDFKISSAGLSMFIGKGKIHYQWMKPKVTRSFPAWDRLEDEPGGPLELESYRMDVVLQGANGAAQKLMEEKDDYYENYFTIKGSGSGVRANSYRRITYKDIYPHIDWVIYSKDGQVEYDFVVHPGGRVSDIRIRYEGAAALQVNGDGSLTARTPMGAVTERAPRSFQSDGKIVTSRFQLKGNELSFDVASYQQALTIDPVLDWCSYYGGDGRGIEHMSNCMTDSFGNVYFSGLTNSTVNIATVGAHRSTFVAGRGSYNSFFAKFTRSGKRLWATYCSNVFWTTTGVSMALDTLGHIYIAAVTDSITGITTPGAQQTIYGGGDSDVFLAKFDTMGNRIWCTYFGGPNLDQVLYRGLACDGKNVYMTGSTQSSSGIATAGAHQPVYNGGSPGGGVGTDDGFLAKFDDNGILQWATYYGGQSADYGYGIVLDRHGDIYMGGRTSTGSTINIATPGSFQPNSQGMHGFLAKFSSNGTRQWGTYFGGQIYTVDCDKEGDVYVFGYTTNGTGITTKGSYQENISGPSDAFIAKFNTTGDLQWGTYYGGESNEIAFGMAVDAWNRIYITGTTKSTTGIADSNAMQPQYAGSFLGINGDGFLAEFTKDGERRWATYWGSKGDDYPYNIAVDNMGSLYICGGTTSMDMATPGSYMDTFPIFGPQTLFQSIMARFCIEVPGSAITLSGPDTVCAYKEISYIAGYLPDVEEYVWELPDGWKRTGTGEIIGVTAGKESGIIRLRIKRCGQLGDWLEYPVYVLPSDPPTITVDGYTLSTAGIYATYQWLLNGVIIPGATKRSYTVTENGDYTVVTVTEEGCLDTSDVYPVRNVSVKDITVADHIRVFPNPASGNILHIVAPIPVAVALYSIDGRLLKYKAADEMINVDSIAPGIYLVRISDRDGNLLKAEKWIRR